MIKQVFGCAIYTRKSSDEGLDMGKVSRKGIVHGNKEFTAMYIYQVLKNPLYLGVVKHHDKVYPGEHKAIIDQETWDKTQELLTQHLQYKGRRRRRLSPMRGMIRCGCCNSLMLERYTTKRGMRYRYYVCEKDVKRINSICVLKRVPAAELESLILKEIGTMLAKPEVIAGVMHEAEGLCEHGKHLKSKAISKAFEDMTAVWDVMFPVERYKFIRSVVESITVYTNRVEIEYKTDGLESIITETETANGTND